MPHDRLVILLAVFFFTSVISVITGSTSLITVPAMIAFGMEPHRAIATNMLALTFMSAGGSLPFMRTDVLNRARLPALTLLTVAGSALGALLLLSVAARALQMIVALAMVAIAAFTFLNQKLGLEARGSAVSVASKMSGYVATLGLAVYGGFFSGGYVTVLTAAFVVLFGMTLLEAVATTKVMNVFSSGIATLIFAWRGLVDWRLGVLLGVAMFLGALLGGRMTLLLKAIWIRRIFVGAVLCLAVKMLLIGQ